MPRAAVIKAAIANAIGSIKPAYKVLNNALLLYANFLRPDSGPSEKASFDCTPRKKGPVEGAIATFVSNGELVEGTGAMFVSNGGLVEGAGATSVSNGGLVKGTGATFVSNGEFVEGTGGAFVSNGGLTYARLQEAPSQMR